MIMSKLFLQIMTIVLLTVVFSVAHAQTGTVSGVVTDQSTGETMPGANVLIKGTLMGQSTDFDGKFSITDVPAGSVVVEASFVGFLPVSRTVAVEAGKTGSK